MYQHKYHLPAYRWIVRSIGLLMGLIPLSAFAAPLQLIPAGTIPVLAEKLTLITSAIYMMTWVVFYFLNILLSPSFIFDMGPGGVSPLMDMLNEIWMLSRDLVNMVFAFALIGVAIVTVVTAKKDFIVEHWKNFVMAVVLVNFSWFFPRVILDFSNILAATIYGIPSLIAVGPNDCKVVMPKATPPLVCNPVGGTTKWECECFYINDAILFATDAQYRAKTTDPAEVSAGWECPLGSIMCYQKRPINGAAIAKYSAVFNGLIVNHARLPSYATIPPVTGRNNVSQLLQFVMREAIVIVFLLMLFFPLLALFIAFVIRIPVLWLTIAFMPFYVLGWVVPEKFTGGYLNKIKDLFLKAAFLPALVAIPFSVGFILVNAGKGVTFAGLDNVTFHLVDDISTLWSVLWTIIAMGVIWTGVFTVLSKMDIMGKGSEMVKGMGETIGGIAWRLPLSAPILPGGKSVLAIDDTIKGLKGGLSSGLSLKDALANARRGGGGGSEAAANDIMKTPAKLGDLNTKIGDLSRAIGNRDNTGRDNALRDIRTQFNMDINPTNPDASFRELAKTLREKGFDPNALAGFETHIDALSTAVRNTANPAAPQNPAAPATPTPTP